MPIDRAAIVARKITRFNWANFGLDEVGEIAPEHAEYAEALATVILAALDGADRGPHGRLARIAEAHHKQVDAHGGTTGDCAECGWTWPCPTYAWAAEDRDVLACWNPSDDEEAEQDVR